MKITVIGKKNHLHWVENCCEAFLALGYSVQKIFLNKQGIVVDTNRNILKLLSKERANDYSSQIIKKQVIRYDPDLVFTISPFILPKEISIVLKDIRHIVKFGWVGDSFTKESCEIANCYDTLFFTDSYFLSLSKELQFPPSHYLSHAYNKNLFSNLNLARKDQILFVGTGTDERVKLLKSIKQKQVLLAGKKWKSYKVFKYQKIINRNVSIQEVASLYNHNSYILNIKDSRNVVNGLNMRTFEAIAAGSFLLQDDVEDIAKNFEIGKEIVVYKSLEDLEELLQKFSKDTSLYKQIIQNGLKKVQAQDTYELRMESVLSYK